MIKLPSRRDEKLGLCKSEALVETKPPLRKMAWPAHQVETGGIAPPAGNYRGERASLPHQTRISFEIKFWGRRTKRDSKYQPRDLFPEMPPRARETRTFDALQFLPAWARAEQWRFPHENTYVCAAPVRAGFTQPVPRSCPYETHQK